MKDIRAFFQPRPKSGSPNKMDKKEDAISDKSDESSSKPVSKVTSKAPKTNKENSDTAKEMDPATFYETYKSNETSPIEKKSSNKAMKRKPVLTLDSDDEVEVKISTKKQTTDPKVLLQGPVDGLSDLKFFLLGSFKDFSNTEYANMIKSHGGKVVPKPMKSVNFAVIGGSIDIDELDKVHAAKCKTIEESDLAEMIQNGAPRATVAKSASSKTNTSNSSSSPTAKSKSNKRKAILVLDDDDDDDDVVESKAPATKTASKRKAIIKEEAEDDKEFKEESVEKQESTPQKKFSYRDYVVKKSAPATMSGARHAPIGKENCMLGLTVVFTGDSKYITREEAQDLVKRYGGKVTTAPSKKTSFVVVGENPGPSKMEKIKTLNLKILNEDEFFDFIEGQPEQEGEKIDYAEKAKELDAHLKETMAVTKTLEVKKPDETTSKKPKTETAVQETRSTVVESIDASMLWTEKYAPTQIKDIIGNKGNVEKLETWLKTWASKLHSGDKSFQRAALISGPPGIGKTTTAVVVSKSLGYEVIEFNASDTRSKKSLDEHVKDVLFNKSISQYFWSKSEPTHSLKKSQVILMDEVDGMSAGDRGGIAELIQFIKKTRTPIICVCNDRSSTKVRNLANYCLDLRFRRPDASQVRSRIMTIGYREGLKLQAAAVDQLVQGTQGDIRQILNILFTWKMTADSLDFDAAKDATKKAKKNFDVGLFDLTTSFFSSAVSVSEKLENYFLDYSFVPLMIQENYIKISTDIEHISMAADSISEGDLIEAKIRGINQSWSLAPSHGIMSCVRPTALAKGHLSERIDFTSWLGNFSKENKYMRILKDLAVHTSLITCGDRQRLRLEYIPTLMKALVEPLSSGNSDNVDEVIKLLDEYYLTKDDYDVMMEFSLDSKFDQKVKAIPSGVKSALTRAYNKTSHAIPYSIGSMFGGGGGGKRGGAASSMQADEEAEVEEAIDENENEDEEDDNDISKDKSIKAKSSKSGGGKAGSSNSKAKSIKKKSK